MSYEHVEKGVKIVNLNVFNSNPILWLIIGKLYLQDKWVYINICWVHKTNVNNAKPLLFYVFKNNLKQTFADLD